MSGMDFCSVFIILGRCIQIPPPSACFEELEQQRSVVTPAYESFIVLEVLALEVKIDFVRDVKGVIELN